MDTFILHWKTVLWFYQILGFKTNKMIKPEELITMRAISICFKPYLKPEEALIFCNLGRTQFAKKCEEFGLFKNNNGYYRREDVEKMLEGEKVTLINPFKKKTQ